MSPPRRLPQKSGSSLLGKTSNGSVKRSPHPKRGYRKFKNGLLNITPRGDSVQMVEKNARESSLLRLPAELRNQIFELALSGHTLKPDAPREEHVEDKRFSLIRSCRQIYAETAILPYRLNTFSFTYLNKMEAWCNRLTPAQRQAVTAVQFPYRREWTDHEGAASLLCFPKLPQLQIVDVVLLGSNDHLDQVKTRFKEGIMADNHGLG